MISFIGTFLQFVFVAFFVIFVLSYLCFLERYIMYITNNNSLTNYFFCIIIIIATFIQKKSKYK